MKPATLLLMCTFMVLLSCKETKTTEIRPDFKKFYDRYKVEGSFVLYDKNNDKYTYYNPDQARRLFTPASTFKICNSLIALETSVVKDENFVIRWDGVTRQRAIWNKDHNLQTAFKYSAVWYYQELARRIGATEMKAWLDKAEYGNGDTTGGLDKFWLSGGLRITTEQQIDFLQRLHEYKLPFSTRSIDIVKKIMIVKDSADYVVRAKTGWGTQDNVEEDIGWYVGYVQTKDNVYYFANCIQKTDANNKDFERARIEIVHHILDALIIHPVRNDPITSALPNDTNQTAIAGTTSLYKRGYQGMKVCALD